MVERGNKLKTLIISNMGPHPGNRALGRFVINQYNELKSRGNDVSLCLMPEFAYLLRGSIYRYLMFSFYFLFFISKSLFKGKFGIIHVHFFYPTIFFALVYKFLFNRHAKIVVTFHGNDVYSFHPEAWLYKKMMKQVDYAIYVSKGLEKLHLNFNHEREVLSAGIKNCFYHMPEINKSYDFIFVGNLEEVKGIDRLLEFIDCFPNYNFLIVGSGSYKKRILNNGGRLKYIETCQPEELATLMNSSHCLLNLSRNESFGLVIAEALSCGISVIATATDGAREQLGNTKNAKVLKQSFKPQDISDSYNILMHQTKCFTGNSKLHYRLENVCERIEEIYSCLTRDE